MTTAGHATLPVNPVSSDQIALETSAANLGANDTNDDRDIYLAHVPTRE